MKKILSLFTLTTLLSVPAMAQSFEGVIEFKKQSTTDTVRYIYYVKGDKVRLDEIGSKSRKVEGSFIVDLKKDSMKSVNHDRKLYMKQAGGSTATPPAGCEVVDTKKNNAINGYKCNQYVVTNTAESTKITYDLASGHFDFFEKFMKVLNRRDKFFTYYLKVLNVTHGTGTFPFLAIQTNMDGKETSRLEVTKVEKKTVPDSQFEVPKDYTLFDK